LDEEYVVRKPYVCDSIVLVVNCTNLVEEIYPTDPRPFTVDVVALVTKSREEIYPADPRPFTVDILSLVTKSREEI
jgi:hypothetical protein